MAPKRVLTVAAMTKIGKGKMPMVSKNADIRKKATFDRGMFTSPQLDEIFNHHFSNRTMIPSKDKNIGNHGYIGTSILQIYRRCIDGYFGKIFL